MKRSFIICISMLLLLMGTAFMSNTQQENANTDPSVYKLMEVIFLWDLLADGFEPNRSMDGTWLNVGFRSKYAMAKRYASIEMVEAAFGVPVFLRGPHKDGDMDFNSTTSFGYYNPQFIAKLHKSVQTVLLNRVFKKAAKRVYDKHLASMAQTYHHAYQYLNKDFAYCEKLQARYLAQVASPNGTERGSLQEEFRDYAEALEKSQQADVYEAFTAPAFWLRRSIDGTDSQLYELLDMVITEMDKE